MSAANVTASLQAVEEGTVQTTSVQRPNATVGTGVVSGEEVDVFANMFALLDMDKDGLISLSELETVLSLLSMNRTEVESVESNTPPPVGMAIVPTEVFSGEEAEAASGVGSGDDANEARPLWSGLRVLCG